LSSNTVVTPPFILPDIFVVVCRKMSRIFHSSVDLTHNLRFSILGYSKPTEKIPLLVIQPSMKLFHISLYFQQYYEVPIAMKAVFDYIDTFSSRIREMEQQKRDGVTCKKEDKPRSLENFLSRYFPLKWCCDLLGIL
uniref:Uncharacterized protein n=1 Tax=Sinocyclocheilus grahami TaxID=75366 RepID=A0A672Q0B9_SINGR